MHMKHLRVFIDSSYPFECIHSCVDSCKIGSICCLADADTYCMSTSNAIMMSFIG